MNSRKIVDILKKRILNGTYPFGSRMPGGRVIAAELGASYLTVYKALCELERNGYAECRGCVGFFPCYAAEMTLPEIREVNLVAPNGEKEAVSRFIREGVRVFEKAGWKVNILLPEGALSKSRLILNKPGVFSVLYGFSPYFNDFHAVLRHLQKRVVIVGESMDNGFTGIVDDISYVMRMLVEHFQKQGRFKTAIICCNTKSYIDNMRIGAWRNLMMRAGHDYHWCSEHAVELNFNYPEMDLIGELRKNFERMLHSGILAGIDSIIIPWSPHANEFRLFCGRNGIRIPDDIALASIGDLSISADAGITSMRSNLPEIMDTALSIAEEWRRGGRHIGTVFLSQPEIVIRKSTMCSTPKKQKGNG